MGGRRWAGAQKRPGHSQALLFCHSRTHETSHLFPKYLSWDLSKGKRWVTSDGAKQWFPLVQQLCTTATHTLHSPLRRSCRLLWSWCFPGGARLPRSAAPAPAPPRRSRSRSSRAGSGKRNYPHEPVTNLISTQRRSPSFDWVVQRYVA